VWHCAKTFGVLAEVYDIFEVTLSHTQAYVPAVPPNLIMSSCKDSFLRPTRLLINPSDKAMCCALNILQCPVKHKIVKVLK